MKLDEKDIDLLSRRQKDRLRKANSTSNLLEVSELRHDVRDELQGVKAEEKIASGAKQRELEERRFKLETELDLLDLRANELDRNGSTPSDGRELPVIGGRAAKAPEGNMLTRSHSFADLIAKRDGRQGTELSVGAYLRALATGAKSDIEERALSETSGASGDYTVPKELSARLIDNLRAQSVAIRAGAITVPLKTAENTIAKVATDPVPAWRSELGAINETDPTFGAVNLQPKSLAALVRVSRELLADSINLEAQLPAVLAAAMAVEVDRAALFGSGSDPEPLGVANVAGIQEVAHDAALSDYSPMVQAQTLVRSANADTSAFILHPRDAGTLNGLTASDGQPLQAPRSIGDVSMLNTTSVPTDLGTDSNESVIVTGAFRHLLVGIREDVGIRMLTERYADTGELAFVVHFRGDVGVEHAEAFAKVSGILP